MASKEQSPLTDMRTSQQAGKSGSATPPAPETGGRRVSPITIIVVVVILLVIGAWFIVSDSGTTVTYDEDGNAITHVSSGVINSFPRRFLLEDGVEVSESYRIDYEGQGNVLSNARYVSAMNLADNINAFGDLFVSEEWSITVEPDYEATGPTNFYATRDREQANVTFVPGDSGVEVIISYLLQR